MATSNAQQFLTSGSDPRGLGLKMFWGRVIEAYRAETILWNAIDGGGPNVIASKMVTGVLFPATVLIVEPRLLQWTRC